MALSEFELIREYFRQSGARRDDVRLGVGDDCALLRVPEGMELAVSIDTLVAGVHFFANCDPGDLGYKALAVNLSDLAAMGAAPAWVTLALVLPESNSEWLEAFSRGFFELAAVHGVQLVGGDTTRGPLTITVQAHGFVEPGKALRRDAAQAGDLIYVTGSLGDAGLALKALRGEYAVGAGLEAIRLRLDRPQPRLAEGRVASGLARAGIDLSDGLISDLGHICAASGVGARLFLERIPLSPIVRHYLAETADWAVPLASGDDYELCLTVPQARQERFEQQMAAQALSVHLIGVIESQPGLRCQLPDNRLLEPLPGGYEHFHHE